MLWQVHNNSLKLSITINRTIDSPIQDKKQKHTNRQIQQFPTATGCTAPSPRGSTNIQTDRRAYNKVETANDLHNATSTVHSRYNAKRPTQCHQYCPQSVQCQTTYIMPPVLSTVSTMPNNLHNATSTVHSRYNAKRPTQCHQYCPQSV